MFITLAEKTRMPKKVLIALPPAMLEQVDQIAETEHRTRSDLVREALRRYIDNFRRRDSITVYANPQPVAAVPQEHRREEAPAREVRSPIGVC